MAAVQISQICGLVTGQTISHYRIAGKFGEGVCRPSGPQGL
jgi:hypothetical protein